MSKVNEAPQYFRASVSTATEAPAVDRLGGRYEAGLIRGVSVITRGEALGHELWVDREFLGDVASHINNKPNGLKARFTHPGLSNDGVGAKLGTVSDAVVDYDTGQVFADLHFQQASTKTPDGNLAEYVMSLAEETPEQFGVSIVFEHDMEATEQHQAENKVGSGNLFVSPDEDNRNNYPHARLSRLRAADVVDDPAANPDGLFKRGQEFAQQGDDLLKYVLGLSDAKPELSCFDVDGDRAAQFVTRFLERHNLNITKGGDPVSDDNDTQVVETPPTRDEFAAELSRYTEAFGAENGAAWFADSVSFSDAQGRHIAEQANTIAALNAKVDELQETLASLNRGEDDGPEFSGSDVAEEKPKSLSGRIRIAGKDYSQN